MLLQKFSVSTSFGTNAMFSQPVALPSDLQLVARVDHAAGAAGTAVPALLTAAAPLVPDTNASLSVSVKGGCAGGGASLFWLSGLTQACIQGVFCGACY